MSARHSAFSQILSAVIALTMVAAVVATLAGQNPAPALTVLSRDGRRTIPLTAAGAQELVALDDLAAAFQLTVREEAGAITVSYKGRTVVLTPDQTLASVSGRLISLSAAPTRVGGRWAVPLDFISRALAAMYDTRVDLRRASRLVVVGDLRVPRLTIRHELLGNAARLTIDATPQATAAVTQDGNQRLTIRFEADALDVVVPAFPPEGFVQGLRLVDPVTIGVDLGPRFGAFRASSETIDTTARLVVDIVAAETPPQTTQAPEPSPPELPQLGPPAIPIRTVAIDAGHGGEDAGARGAQGTLEKNITLAVARRLKTAVESRLGIRVVMTRDDDRNVPVNDRTAIANNNKADLFISFHANASFRNTVKGATVFVAAFDEAAAREAPAPERLPVFGGGTRDIELLPWNLAQIRHRDDSAQMADLIAAQFQGRVPLAARPVEHAPLRVLESANMPAVLIEIGYLTNADQEKQLAGAEYQTAVAQGVLDAIVKFRDVLGASEGGTR